MLLPDLILAECEKVNPPMGISCVKHIISYYKKGDYQSALNVCIGENDKIRQYPTVRNMLFILFPEYLHDLEHTRKLFGWNQIQ